MFAEKSDKLCRGRESQGGGEWGGEGYGGMLTQKVLKC